MTPGPVPGRSTTSEHGPAAMVRELAGRWDATDRELTGRDVEIEMETAAGASWPVGHMVGHVQPRSGHRRRSSTAPHRHGRRGSPPPPPAEPPPIRRSWSPPSRSHRVRGEGPATGRPSAGRHQSRSSGRPGRAGRCGTQCRRRGLRGSLRPWRSCNTGHTAPWTKNNTLRRSRRAVPRPIWDREVNPLRRPRQRVPKCRLTSHDRVLGTHRLHRRASAAASSALLMTPVLA